MDDACDFMARAAGVNDTGEKRFLGDHVAVADAAGFHFHADFSGAGIGDGALHNFDRTVGNGDLSNSHEPMMPPETVTTQEIEMGAIVQ